MKHWLLFSICAFCSTFIECAETQEVSSGKNVKMFSMTPEEMVFASKLNDENRRRFCYQLSTKERLMAMKQAQESAQNADSVLEAFFQNLSRNVSSESKTIVQSESPSLSKMPLPMQDK
jgi:hypothetical protein